MRRSFVANDEHVATQMQAMETKAEEFRVAGNALSEQLVAILQRIADAKASADAGNQMQTYQTTFG